MKKNDDAKKALNILIDKASNDILELTDNEINKLTKSIGLNPKDESSWVSSLIANHIGNDYINP